MRSASSYGRGLSRMASTKLKMATLAPTPIAKVRTATIVNPRLFLSVRPAYRRSWLNDDIFRLLECSP